MRVNASFVVGASRSLVAKERAFRYVLTDTLRERTTNYELPSKINVVDY